MTRSIIEWDRDRASIYLPHYSDLDVRPCVDASGRMVLIETGNIPIWLDTDTAEILGSQLIEAANAGVTAA